MVSKPNVFIDVSFVLALLGLFSLQRPTSLICIGFVGLAYSVFRASSFTIEREWAFCTFWVVLVLALPVFLGLNHGFSALFYLFSTVVNIYAAKRFCSFPLGYVRRCLEIVFWFFVMLIISGAWIHREAAEPIGEIIPGSSTNGLPTYLIIVQVAFAIAELQDKGKLPVLSAAATFIVAVVGLGRGSIVVSAIAFLFTCLFNIILGKKSRRGEVVAQGFYGLLVFFAAVGGCVFYFLACTDIAHSKWVLWGVTDPPRARMLQDYIAKLNWWSVLWGADYSGTVIESVYAGSPHNSYIRLHSYFGFLGVLLVGISPFLSLFSRESWVNKLIFIFFTLLVLLRATTEPILFPTALDFFYFLYFFLFFKVYDVGRVLRARE